MCAQKNIFNLFQKKTNQNNENMDQVFEIQGAYKLSKSSVVMAHEKPYAKNMYLLKKLDM